MLLLKVPSPAHEKPPKGTEDDSRPLNGRLALLFLAFFFLYGGSESGFGAWIFSYATHSGLTGATQAAYLTSLFYGLLGMGRLLGIPIVARIPANRFLSILIPLVLVSLTALLLWPGSRTALWICTAGAGLGMASIFPLLLIYAGPILSGGSRVSGKVTSYLFVGASMGSMTLPWLMGQAFEPWGPRAAMAIVLVAFALMGTIFLAILRQAE